MARGAPALLALLLHALSILVWRSSGLSLVPAGDEDLDLRATHALALGGARGGGGGLLAAGRKISGSWSRQLDAPLGSDQGGQFEVARVAQGEKVTLPSNAAVLDAWYGLDAGDRVNITAKVGRQLSSGNRTVHALGRLYGDAAPGQAKVLQVVYVRALETSPRAAGDAVGDAAFLGGAGSPPRGVSVLVQVGNPRYWVDMKACAANVSSAMQRLGDGFQVLLAFQDEIPGDERRDIVQDAQRSFGAGSVRSLVGENRGADIGLYLQQLKALDKESQGGHFDMFLKIHTKSDESKRRGWLRDLCGDPGAVARIYGSLRASDDLGMVGAANQVVQYPHRTEEYLVWTKADIRAMERAWNEMQPCVPFDIPLKQACIVTGSFFWVRSEVAMDAIVLHSFDQLLDTMPRGYQANSDGQTSHALERLLPTLVAAVRGLAVRATDKLAGA